MTPWIIQKCRLASQNGSLLSCEPAMFPLPYVEAAALPTPITLLHPYRQYKWSVHMKLMEQSLSM